MVRIETALRSGVAFAALITATGGLQAQSTLPPPDVVEEQASPAAEPATQASPATEPSSQGDIVVTGSRIRRDPLSQDSPIVFVDQADIAKTGLNSINDVLQRLPSSGGGLNGKFNNSGNLGNPPDGGGVGAGSAEIDLRYLGSRRVLVLVDGIRYVNGASASGVPGSTDLNSIPESAIERIEVLQDGASAIYGSDAIAGVVNIITKHRQAGFVASAQLGKYLDDGDGGSQNYQLSWGNGDSGATQVVIGGNFVKQGGIFAGDRAISAFPSPFSTSCADGGCSGYLPNGRFFFGPDDLTLIAPVVGRPTTPADFRDRVPASAGNPGDTFNFAPFNYVQIPVERLGLFVNLRQEMSDTVNFSLKGIWNRRVSKNQAAPLPLGIGPGAGNGNFLDTISIDATNPFNPFGVDLLTSDTEDAILRRNVEIGPRRFEQTVKTYYWVATLDGRFNFLDSDWFWDINGSYGRNKADQIFLGNINGEKLAQALGPISECTAPCVPFNIFGGAGTITQEMLDFVGFREHDQSDQTQWDFTGNLSGKLFDLPGGPLGVALGVEYRDLNGAFDPDPVVAAGFGADIPAQPTAGGYNVKEAYLELNAPLLANRPFFELLELDGAMRWSDYSSSGSTTTFKAGVNWKPISDLRLRGSWSEGFRAPTIGELFGSQTRFDQSLEDPCSSHPTNQAPRNFQNDAAVRQNCITLGVPADGSYQQANPQISVLTGGNEDLTPETSKGWVAGAVYSPGFLPRFSIETNYYKIKVDKAIQAVGASTTLNACIFNLDPTACALVTRLTNGQVTQIRGLLQNIAGIKTDGLDLNVTYRTPSANWGQLGFTWNNSFLFNYHETVPTATGTAVIKREGTERGSPDQAYPKWKSIGILDWNGYDFGATLTGRYVKSVDEVDADNKLGSRFYTDIQLRWDPQVNWVNNLGLAVGVNNLLDKDPPGCISCSINNFDPTTYDVPGRYYYARVGVKM